MRAIAPRSARAPTLRPIWASSAAASMAVPTSSDRWAGPRCGARWGVARADALPVGRRARAGGCRRPGRSACAACRRWDRALAARAAWSSTARSSPSTPTRAHACPPPQRRRACCCGAAAACAEGSKGRRGPARRAAGIRRLRSCGRGGSEHPRHHARGAMMLAGHEGGPPVLWPPIGNGLGVVLLIMGGDSFRAHQLAERGQFCRVWGLTSENIATTI